MYVEQALRLAAGVVVSTSALLAAVHSEWWLILTGFAGVNLFQSAFTNWCPAVWLFEKMGLQRCQPVPTETASAET